MAAKRWVREVMGVSDDYHVLFLQGGASFQFQHAAAGLHDDQQEGRLHVDRPWAQKAIEAASKLGTVNIVGSSKDKKWSYLPEIAAANRAGAMLANVRL